MFKGLTTITYKTDDQEAAKKWYSDLLGIEPYFHNGPYIEFRIGPYEHELGILDRKFVPYEKPAGPAGVVVYWAVDDCQAALDRLLEHGATLLEAPRDFGEGFIGASVVDPFGNIVGVMDNPKIKEVWNKYVKE